MFIKSSLKKTLEVSINIYQNRDNNKLYVYATVPEVLQETVQIWYYDEVYVENFDAMDGSFLHYTNEYELTISKGYSVSNEVQYFDTPAYAYDVYHYIGYDSVYYDFEYEYDY